MLVGPAPEQPLAKQVLRAISTESITILPLGFGRVRERCGGRNRRWVLKFSVGCGVFDQALAVTKGLARGVRLDLTSQAKRSKRSLRVGGSVQPYAAIKDSSQ